LNPRDDEAIAARIARSDALQLVARGRSMGLAIAAEREVFSPHGATDAHNVSTSRGAPAGANRGVHGRASSNAIAYQNGRGLSDARAARTAACVELVAGLPAHSRTRSAPKVLDLSALWAGPLAAHLLWLAGAEVVKVESRTRPDAMRAGDNPFYSLLNQGKASVALDFRETIDRQALLSLIASSDIVIEAARPRALLQLGIDAAELVRTTPGLVWMTLTGHGATGEAANWVGFGDDCAVAGGLSAALHAATGTSGFVGDAIADPLTGMLGTLTAWQAWLSGRGGRFALAMSHVVAQCLSEAREQDAAGLSESLRAWNAAVGKPFPTVQQRPIGTAPTFGAHTCSCIAEASRSHAG
jgi:hypothetical protein